MNHENTFKHLVCLFCSEVLNQKEKVLKKVLHTSVRLYSFQLPAPSNNIATLFLLPLRPFFYPLESPFGVVLYLKPTPKGRLAM